MSPNSLKRLEMSGPPQTESQSQLKSLNQLDLSFTKAERNNVCQILDLAPKLVHLVYLGNSANQLACIENNNIQELELGFTDMLTVLGKYLLFQIMYVLCGPSTMEQPGTRPDGFPDFSLIRCFERNVLIKNTSLTDQTVHKYVLLVQKPLKEYFEKESKKMSNFYLI